jgi:hypothetical protein
MAALTKLITVLALSTLLGAASAAPSKDVPAQVIPSQDNPDRAYLASTSRLELQALKVDLAAIKADPARRYNLPAYMAKITLVYAKIWDRAWKTVDQRIKKRMEDR